MHHPEEITDLLARYAAEVGRHLPPRGREDIKREILATLQDRLDDRLAGGGRTATTDDAVELLREAGHPRKTATSYSGHTALVGPELYPLFTLVCRIALPIVGAVLLAVTTLSAALGGGPSAGVAERILAILGSSISAVAQAFAAIVVVFMLIERATPREKLEAGLASLESWDPRTLPAAEATGRVEVGEQIASIVFCTVWIVALLFLPDILRLAAARAGATPVALSIGLLRLVPLLIADAAVEILVAVFLIARGRHSGATTAAGVASKVLGIVVAGLLLAVWPFVLTPGAASEGVEIGVRILNQLLRVGCILGVVFGAVDVVRRLAKWFRTRGNTR